MIGPLQLANCTSSDLPIVTLDSQGFVSTYNQKIELCADGSYYTWNVFKGREEMSETNTGQYLLQKLNPIMIQRKKDKNWEVDAWTEAHATNDMGNPDEAIVIFVDASGGMGAEMGAGWMENQATATATSTQAQNQMSRMTEVKDVFRNLVSRISAYNLPTHLGLVTFSSPSQVRVAQPLTPVLLNFQH
ncbi:hypothetical protein BKA65DRAFT_575619 [Rhexocercosporidium sp. MPI-PUGE-AT-0058]|nr:hypothetical protein BKA65DRAFT_575619 [Rhexocercosporidium sp. MPI-PUGE-AT-0058]